MRLGPAPYAWLNYACSLSSDIRRAKVEGVVCREFTNHWLWPCATSLHVIWMSSLFALSTPHLYRFFPYITASLLGRSPHNLIDIWVGGGVSEAGEIAQ